MDRAAAKEALASFTNGKTLTANQIEFVNLIVDHLTEHGVVEAARLYESPFTDLTPHGPEGSRRARWMNSCGHCTPCAQRRWRHELRRRGG
jgi:hypothetical protein